MANTADRARVRVASILPLLAALSLTACDFGSTLERIKGWIPWLSGDGEAAVEQPTRLAPPKPAHVFVAVPRARIESITETDPFGYPLGTPDKLELLNLLHARDWAALNEALGFYQAAFEQDFHKEHWARHAFSAFANGDPVLEPLLDEWVAKWPEAFQPSMARAFFHTRRGPEAQAAGLARGASDRRFADMRKSHQRAIADATFAVEMNPKLVVGYELLIRISMLTKDEDLGALHLHRALEASPQVFEIRNTYMQRLLPRWGGSRDMMRQFADDALAHVAENRKLALLGAWLLWDEASFAAEQGQHPQAIELYTQALQTGESATLLRDRGRSFYATEQYGRAWEDLDRAAALAPQDPQVLAYRAEAGAAMGRSEQAISDLELAEALDSRCTCLADARSNVSEQLADLAARAQEEGSPEEALDVLDAAVYVFPSPRAYLLRGQARAALGRRDPAIADLEAATRLAGDRIFYYEQTQAVLEQLEAWDRSVAIWSRYLRQNPRDADAYLVRSRSYEKLGDDTRAASDVKRSCELGNATACEATGMEAAPPGGSTEG